VVELLGFERLKFSWVIPPAGIEGTVKYELMLGGVGPALPGVV
jgi:hypothetical protein